MYELFFLFTLPELWYNVSNTVKSFRQQIPELAAIHEVESMFFYRPFQKQANTYAQVKLQQLFLLYTF